MDEEMRKKVEKRAQEILDNPEEHRERWMRQMAERIAYHELLEEEEMRAKQSQSEEPAS